jgi:subtilisin family serine protease
MRRNVLAGLVLVLFVSATGTPLDARGASTAAQADPGAVSGSWIVTLVDHSDPSAEAAGLAGRHGGRVGHVYEHALMGFQFLGSEQAAAALARNPRVVRVEADGVATVVHHRDGHDGGPPGNGGGDDGGDGPSPPDDACDNSGQTEPWGIRRIGAVTSHSSVDGACISISTVRAYVIDTGVDQNHGDLNVVGHVNFAGGPNRDCHGHGTHVAGTIAARDDGTDVVGVTPNAVVVGVKVLNCAGSGSWSGVIAGIDWVAANAVKPAVANLSLGGGAITAVDDAVKNLADSGVTVAVAAGNSGADACNYSPARAGTHNGVITVAATNSNDGETSWSNYGGCVDIWAPGAAILSTANGGGTTTMSGTSMASPHAAGTAARYLSGNTGASASTTEGAMKSAAQPLPTASKDGRTIVLVHAGAF